MSYRSILPYLTNFVFYLKLYKIIEFADNLLFKVTELNFFTDEKSSDLYFSFALVFGLILCKSFTFAGVFFSSKRHDLKLFKQKVRLKKRTDFYHLFTI